MKSCRFYRQNERMIDRHVLIKYKNNKVRQRGEKKNTK